MTSNIYIKKVKSLEKTVNYYEWMNIKNIFHAFTLNILNYILFFLYCYKGSLFSSIVKISEFNHYIKEIKVKNYIYFQLNDPLIELETH